jgi:hypothetical protein
VFPQEEAARAAYDGITSKDTRTCLAEGLVKGLGESGDVEAGESRTSRLAVDPLGDEREAARIVVPVTTQGVDADLIFDIVYVRTGRAIALCLFADAFSAFDDELREDLTGKVVRRLSAGIS